MAMEFHQLTSETSESLPYKKTPNPSLHPTANSGLRPLPSARELKRWTASVATRDNEPWLRCNSLSGLSVAACGAAH